jgi:selenocysteine-specific elongation factor
VGRRVVIGTAGHIDHGKTALVKALTGVDTDRWEEEKRRGITIDLGFAPLSLGAGVEASIVDVPGHEGFVRNMLAGATGIDVALLVIAADEGVMPQTAEHLAILELLGVRCGIPVLAKADAVDAEWLELVRTEVAARLAGSRVAWEPPIATSAVSGQGLDALRDALRRVVEQAPERQADDVFRLPIDRVFAVAGAGTVVTGTTWSGTVAVGDSVRVLPLDRDVRVRSIEVHGRPAGRAEPGRRTAIALVGVDRSELARGDALVAGPAWAATVRLDAVVEVLAGARAAITTRTRVRVHLGTAEVLARAAPAEPLAAGSPGRVRLVLERPLVARGGDRFVLRSYSPVATIGGGIVLDPRAPSRPRLLERSLDPMQTPAERLAVWVEEAGLNGLAEAELPVRLGIRPALVTEVIAAAGKGVLRSQGVLLSRAAAALEAARLGDLVRGYQGERPLEPGHPLEALRAAMKDAAGRSVPPAVADAVLDLGVRKRVLEVAGTVVRSPGWVPTADAAASARLAARLAAAHWQIPTVAELEAELGGVPVRALLVHLTRSGGVAQVDRERYAAPAALATFRAALDAALAELGQATPAQLRDRFGLTRKYLIPLLEWADRSGITRRAGDARTLARLTAPSDGS